MGIFRLKRKFFSDYPSQVGIYNANLEVHVLVFHFELNMRTELQTPSCEGKMDKF